MSTHNKVVWSEGLFLQPQHFQQQERYFERYIETRCQALVSHSWGFADVEIERDFLGIGKFGVRRATAVFPDGTPVRLPDDDPAPEPIDIGVSVRDQIVYLALPIRRPQAVEIDRAGGPDDLARQFVRELEARDVTSDSADAAVLRVGVLNTRLLLAADVTPAYACVPLAHIVECRQDKQVVLDEAFIPTVLQARWSTRLSTFLKELLALLRQRGEALAGRVTATGRGGAAEIADYLMLQVVNRYEPIVAHLADSPVAHPEALYQLLASAAGELSTFTTPGKRAPVFPGYVHERLRESFEPVMAALRSCLSAVLEQTAVRIPIEPRKYGISVAIVPDRTLYDTAVFVLAARADMPSEELRRGFPTQLKMAPVEKITSLVNLQLSGIPVQPMPTAPRQIPFHAGFVYFELDQHHELWAALKTSGGIGIFTGNFPGLALEFWAIRSS
jgi:type VI secretion system protein ImpJ